MPPYVAGGHSFKSFPCKEQDERFMPIGQKVGFCSRRACWLDPPQFQEVLILVQPCLSCLPIRQDRADQSPEVPIMGSVAQMTEFVSDRIFEHCLRRKDQMPVP